MLGFTIAMPKERFSEFYLLGPEGKAEGYPVEFKMDAEGRVYIVKYDQAVKRRLEVESELRPVEENMGRVILGIVNQEHEDVSYDIEVRIGVKRSPTWLDGEMRDTIGPIRLVHGQEIQLQIGLIPQQIGDKQKVDFMLFKEGKPYLKNYLWINVRT
jgi:uncharacterized membrane protein